MLCRFCLLPVLGLGQHLPVNAWSYLIAQHTAGTVHTGTVRRPIKPLHAQPYSIGSLSKDPDTCLNPPFTGGSEVPNHLEERCHDRSLWQPSYICSSWVNDISSLVHSPAALKWIRAPFPVPSSSPCVDPAAVSSESWSSRDLNHSKTCPPQQTNFSVVAQFSVCLGAQLHFFFVGYDPISTAVNKSTVMLPLSID